MQTRFSPINHVHGVTPPVVTATPPPLPTPEPVTMSLPPSTMKKVSFGKITAKKEDTKTSYPVFPDGNGEAAQLATRIIENTEIYDAAKGSLDADKARLKDLVIPHFFAIHHGRFEVPSSIAVVATEVEQVKQRLTGGSPEVLVTFQDKYSSSDEGQLVRLLGDRTPQFFRQSFDIKISGDKLPGDHVDELIAGLQELFGKYNALDALEVKDGIKPVAEFHAARHREFDPALNLLLQGVCPMQVVIKTKGRKRG
jgi:hypothetical protein